eukprot:jgi/Mesen1/6259/ME000323S05386
MKAHGDLGHSPLRNSYSPLRNGHSPVKKSIENVPSTFDIPHSWRNCIKLAVASVAILVVLLYTRDGIPIQRDDCSLIQSRDLSARVVINLNDTTSIERELLENKIQALEKQNAELQDQAKHRIDELTHLNSTHASVLAQQVSLEQQAKSLEQKVRSSAEEAESLKQKIALKAEDDVKQKQALPAGLAKRVKLITALWEASGLLQLRGTNHSLVKKLLQDSSFEPPGAPHLQDCIALDKATQLADWGDEQGNPPLWSVQAGNNPDASLERLHQDPPWVTGGEDDSLAKTREAQADIWHNQHPINCSAPDVKFLVLEELHENGPKYLGLGAQIRRFAGALAHAMREKRVLVLLHFERADHRGCHGKQQGKWGCYFVPETSDQCRQRAESLMSDADAVTSGAITTSGNYTTFSYWFPKVPRDWGQPWVNSTPSIEINQTLVTATKQDDLRWWRAQAERYLMRLPSAYTCRLMNRARHAAFRAEVAEDVARGLPSGWPKERPPAVPRGELEAQLWHAAPPYIPQPLVSVHIRQGDKGIEMRVASFDEYMALVARLQHRFPHVNRVWLSTEMQPVIEETRKYPHLRFYYSDVRRQGLLESMHDYEARLGKQRSTDNGFVNLLMAANCQLFVGALGSTWSSVIDDLRVTGGKLRQGFMTVNLDRFW